MVRAMFLDYPNDYTLGTATRYQFLYGPYVLVAPVYQNTQADADGNDVRNGIYLPEGNWIDYFTGDLYQGGRILHIPADTRSAFPVISVQSPVSIQCCWQS